ncbi:RNA ligase [Paeniglutamicibacter terrestris]|uniref:2'-5' RNA ligase n=1 Tax=Paeniglutamicibacter terrestris TaxID=2723403 RepID=A0ABX1G7I7_9MICC|nr:RNA ligase [Paeniglutamicibacter terrestris]NKG22233.1 2'-5' RNA ligase [Paeniglutamicibacter terrestris]
MYLQDLLDPTELKNEIAAGYVRAQKLNELTILNYTDKAQYDRHWNLITTQCRGLIVKPNGQVIARPFPKFFNTGEPEAILDLTAPVTVTDKLDGSLGIAYVIGGKVRIATRGSMSSEQAIHATGLLNKRYPDWMPPAGITVLFEIIYPENRIVVDYGPLDALILLGAIDIETGTSVTPAEIEWPGDRATVFPFETLAEAFDAPARKNAEGFVVHFHGTDTRVKIKQDDYVRLHRIVTGWNERTVWEHLAAGESLAELTAGLPDEFHRWADNIGKQLLDQHNNLVDEAETAYRTLTEYVLPADFDRKDFALEASKHPLRPAIFSLLDGKDIHAWAWKQIRPTTQKEASLV